MILVALAVEESVAAAQHQLSRGLPGESGARAEVIVIAIHNRARVAVLAGQRVLPVLDVEEAAEIARIHRLREELVAQAEIQREPAGDLPIVLHEAAGIDGALAAPVEHRRALDEARVSEQKIGETAGRTRAHSSWK